MPFPDASFDLVFADWVVEHLEEPARAMREVVRILRPGGYFLFRTGNLSHYVYAIASITPMRFHRMVAQKAGRAAHRTFYRFNRRRRIGRVLSQVGFDEVEMRMVEPEPGYLAFSVPTLLLGIAYERIVNISPFFAGIRACILGCFRKRA